MSDLKGMYLLHFDKQLSHAKHYLGATNNLERRLKEHALGQGARITQVLQEKRIEWILARFWKTEDAFWCEEILKTHKNAPHYCPICKVLPHEFARRDHFPLDLITFPISSRRIRQWNSKPKAE